MPSSLLVLLVKVILHHIMQPDSGFNLQEELTMKTFFRTIFCAVLAVASLAHSIPATASTYSKTKYPIDGAGCLRV